MKQTSPEDRLDLRRTVKEHVDVNDAAEQAKSGTPRRPWTLLLFLLVGRHPQRTLLRVIVLAVVCVVLFRYLIPPVYVQGISMEPTYRDRTLHFSNSLKYTRQEPRRGDVVVIQMAGRRVMFLKRILGLPGDTIEFRRGALIVNGETVDEPYIEYGGFWTMGPVLLGEAEYFVAGDNRSMDRDSHMHGIVDRSRIAGGVIF